MTIAVVPNSASISIVSRPVVNMPLVAGAGTFMRFSCTAIGIKGECKITGTAGDNPIGWTLGLIQLKFIDTDWAYYRGRSNRDGSSFLQYSRPPALPTGGCRDTLVAGGIFIDNNPGHDRTVVAAGTRFPVTMSAEFSDDPSRGFYLRRRNGLTNKDNFLREAQTELHFCTILSLMSPAGVFQHLKSVYWNVHWQGRFEPANFGNLAGPWNIAAVGGLGNTAHISSIIDGPPKDRRFSGIVTAPGTPNCNDITLASYRNPNLRESRVWATFDVTR
jgi:hypothetical protein